MMTDHSVQLRIALDEYMLNGLAGMPSEAELSSSLIFSRAFEKRMRKLIEKSKRSNSQVNSITHNDAVNHHVINSKFAKRLLLVAILLSISISVMSITAARESLFGFIIRIYESFSTMIFDQETQKQNQSYETDGTDFTSDRPSRNDIPTHLPEGYEKVDKLAVNGYMQIIYANSSGDELIFERQLADSLQVMIDTEGIEPEAPQIMQFKSLYYSNKSVQTLIWQDGSFVFIISGKASKSELLEMANSLYSNIS